MKIKKISLITLIIFSLSISLSTFSTQTYAFTQNDADQAIESFNSVYWDADKKYFYCNSDRLVHSEHAHGPEGGLYTDFWWEAQLWNVVMDAYERTSSTTYLQQLNDVYDGFVACYPDFVNDFNDDIAWWALGCARAYELTDDIKYLNTCKMLFDRMYEHCDNTYGGGIWWKNNSHDQKNVATNGAAAIIAMKISQHFSDQTIKNDYMNKAVELYNWIENNLSDKQGHLYDHIEGDNKLVKWDFTYNFGLYIGAANELYKATNDVKYKNSAKAAADWAITYLTNNGVLVNEGDGDGGGFKLVFNRCLYDFIKNDLDNNQTYLKFLQNNATSAWNHRRSSDNITGTDWSANTSDNYVQSLTAASAISILNLIPADGYIGVVEGNNLYEAENSERKDITTESKDDESGHDGHTGRGYLAGWNSNNSYVTFKVNVKETKSYNLDFRYAAGAGNATRKVIVNGSTKIDNLTFNNTDNWDTWQTSTLNNITLAEGYNTVKVIYSSNSGNSNWLNLDSLSISEGTATPAKNPYDRIEAENFDIQNGVIAEDCNDGTQNIGGIQNNDFTAYLNYDFGNISPNTFEVRASSDTNGGNIEIHLDSVDGPQVGTINISSTGGWSNYQTTTTSLDTITGIHDIYLVYKGDSYLFNINWFKFIK